jgi:hypothetical protein
VPTWSGWEAQFLNRAGIIVTPPNMSFLDSWARNAETACANNPIDLSHKLTGSSDCHALPGIVPKAQRYGTHAEAATAFRDEVHASWAAALLHALNTGNAYQVSNPGPVAEAIATWGSVTFARVYLAAAQKGGPGSGPAAGAGSDIHHGWTSVRRSLNRTWGRELKDSRRNVRAALRAVGRGGKVRR